MRVGVYIASKSPGRAASSAFGPGGWGEGGPRRCDALRKREERARLCRLAGDVIGQKAVKAQGQGPIPRLTRPSYDLVGRLMHPWWTPGKSLKKPSILSFQSTPKLTERGAEIGGSKRPRKPRVYWFPKKKKFSDR
jgi:hypothetical protein